MPIRAFGAIARSGCRITPVCVLFRDNPRAGTPRSSPSQVASTATSPARNSSAWASATRRSLDGWRFPRPQINARVAGYEVDALFPQQRLIVELDGWRYHSDRQSFESDRDRDADTLAADHITIRVTWERLIQTPDHEAQRLRRIIANRS
ncbi:MAG: endonuclease domain-containing protein [Solirubrobacteraceae bacterium]